MRQALHRGLIRARDLIIDSAPLKAWRRGDPDAQHGHAPAHHRTRFLHGYRVVFRPQCPPLTGWAAVTACVALSFTATILVALTAHQAGRPDLIRSPKRVLAHLGEGVA